MSKFSHEGKLRISLEDLQWKPLKIFYYNISRWRCNFPCNTQAHKNAFLKFRESKRVSSLTLSALRSWDSFISSSESDSWQNSKRGSRVTQTGSAPFKCGLITTLAGNSDGNRVLVLHVGVFISALICTGLSFCGCHCQIILAPQLVTACTSSSSRSLLLLNLLTS